MDLTRDTQEFLNYFLLCNRNVARLTVDGIYGHKTREAVKVAIETLKERFKKHEFEWNPKFNLIGIRTSFKVTNKFDDWGLLIEDDNMLIAVPMSTKAGKPAIQKYYNRWLRGKRGFGTVKENQQIDYLVVEPQSGNAWSQWTGGIGFLFQDKPIAIYRDPNLNDVIDTGIIAPRDIGGAFNVHSYLNWTYKIVHNLSEGCQVFQYQYWKVVWKYILQNKENNRMVYTLLLHEN